MIAAAAILAYANALSGPFIFDDSSSVLTNRTIERLGDIQAIARPPFETPVAGRPLVNLTFAVNYAIGRHDVVGYHVANVLFHLGCGLLLFGIVRRTWPDLFAASAIALVWTIHPLNTEAVNYVTQRTELVMALCLLATIYASIRARETPRLAWQTVAVASCALGMAAKESMVVTPLLVLVFDRIFAFPTWRSMWDQRRWFYASLAATWLVLIFLGAGSERALSAGFTAHDANAWVYLLNQTQVIARYLRLAFMPVGLAIDYGLPQPLTFGDVWPYALGLGTLAAGTIAALVRWPRIGFLGFWFFVTLAPTSSILPIPTEVGAERRMYLPLIAVISLVIAAAQRTWQAQRSLATGVFGAVCAVLLGLTWARNSEYQSALMLTETTVARYPTAAAESMYGTELAAAGRLAEAEGALRRATAGYPPAHFYLATVLSARGDSVGALREFDAFIASQPPELAQVKSARLFAADLHAKAGTLEEAAAQYNALLALYPQDGTVLSALAGLRVRQQQYPEAIALYQRLLSAEPGNLSALNGLGVALISSGRVEEAIAAFQRVVDIAPDRPGARSNLDRAIALRGK